MEPAQAHHTNVFLVEDSAPIRARLAELLGDMSGVSIVGEAETPAAAIAGILQTRPDSVVLDFQLIGGSGVEVLRKVCPVAPDIVFIMLSNYTEPQYRDVCLQSGARYYLDKTAEFTKVRDVIAAIGATH